MCSGRVDLEFILRAFANGMDGVFIGGCRLNECNYITHGNYHALNLVLLCKRIMAHIGLNPERLSIEFMSSGEGLRFTEVVDDFCTRIKKLGPVGHSETAAPDRLASRLDEVRRLVPYIKLEKREKLASRLESPEAYEAFFTEEEVDRLFSEVVAYYIDPERCQACMICRKRCPVEAISGGKNQIHVIDQDKCIKCGSCFEACPPRFGAVDKIVGTPVPPSLPEDRRAIVRSRQKG